MKPTDDIRKLLSEKFNNFEASPQESSWVDIGFALDLKDKFCVYEAKPQAETFNKIQRAIELTAKFEDYEAKPLTKSDESIIATILLRDKFSVYTAEPHADSWKIIKAALAPEKEARIVFFPFAFRMGIAASIVLLLSFVWLFNINKEKKGSIAVSKNEKIFNNQLFIGQKNKDLVTNIKPKTGIMLEKKVDSNKINIPSSITTGQSSSSKSVAFNKKSNVTKSFYSDNLTNHQVAEMSIKKQEDLLQNELKKSFLEENTIKKSINPDNEVALNLIDKKDFKQPSMGFPFGEIAYNNEVPIGETKVRIRRKMVLTSSIMPLQTYQALTILPQTSAYVQQVGSLNAFDAQRLGLQARIGVMQALSNRFSVGVSLAYAGTQQVVNYEINNGVYDIDLTTINYTTVGVGEIISQNKFIHTFGLKLDNSYLLSSRKNKIFILGGVEGLRLLNNPQYSYYLNASVAFSYPIRGGKSVSIEPTYRYSLSQSFDANNYLQIRPSNIGLNIRINFR